MPHAIWRGSISFGLVTIPVTLFPAEDTKERLAFHMLDGTDLSPVRQKRVSERTGEEIPWDRIVKGYDLGGGRWVVMSDDDFRQADVEATQTIDILSAVCADQIAPEYFSKPYYLEPSKPGRKAYALLRETLARSKRVAVAKIVIRSKQHLAALIPEGDMLLLELLRYPHELRDSSELDLPAGDLESTGVTEAELKMASQLVEAIEATFDPLDERYRDTYHDSLLALIARKAAGVPVIATPAAKDDAPAAEVVDIVELLKRSLSEAKRAQG
ncbi:MAG: Ku protein [Coriobacteriia bacterium]|nr:Ku protein [Coriobacteriia bacterium]